MKRFHVVQEFKATGSGPKRDMVIYSGAKVFRFDFWSGEEYMLSFALDGVKLPRLESNGSGIPILNGHLRNNVATIGQVESVRTVAGMGLVGVGAFLEDDPVIAKIDAGMVRAVSMEAMPLGKPRDATPKGAAMRELVVDEWELQAVAVLPVGADPQARLLGEETAEGLEFLWPHARRRTADMSAITLIAAVL